jgi:cytochrome c biogenesis protein CcmG/thiol:disulfide interchange protein DsbE
LTTVADPARKVSRDDLHGRVYLLSVWASWCVACREEHPLLNELTGRKAVTIIGLNYKDNREDALRWLGALGNPYEVSLSDRDGRLGIDLGVYGVPETFVIDKQGVIRYKQIGPMTPEVWEQKLAPLIKELS